ncbi:MAG: toxin-antitoxin system HicB family antitoxin [Chloroflexi bacterium]|nr:toxin-antitoxin system HicB family antitoxin [Chloroflexota bacterium]
MMPAWQEAAIHNCCHHQCTVYDSKFIVRVPKELHRSLVRAAQAEGISLNLYVATVLAQAIGQSIPTRLAS